MDKLILNAIADIIWVAPEPDLNYGGHGGEHVAKVTHVIYAYADEHPLVPVETVLSNLEPW